MAMSLVFVVIKMNFFLLIFLQLLIGNFSEPIRKKRKYFAFGNGAKFRPQKWPEKGKLSEGSYNEVDLQ